MNSANIKIGLFHSYIIIIFFFAELFMAFLFIGAHIIMFLHVNRLNAYAVKLIRMSHCLFDHNELNEKANVLVPFFSFC